MESIKLQGFSPQDILNPVSLNVDVSDGEPATDLLTYSWENINVSVTEKTDGFDFKRIFSKNKPPQKRILTDVNGIAKPGQLLAIMGASGSGKTTLLDVLNFRNKLNISGSIKINGQNIRSKKSLSFISGYVTQDDLFLETLTVKEHLTFHAMLRLSKAVSEADRLERVEQVLSDLNLKKCEDTFIGDPQRGIKGISNGEKRRLAVATELLTNASLLMADEPTSGLDSFMAVAIVECLKNLARKGKTIICTIHQPSSDIFKMFDQLYLLAEGRLAFGGSLAEASQFFASQQLVCPRSYNPADFFIQKLAVLPSQKEQCLARVNAICDNFKASRFNSNLQNDLKQINNSNSRFTLYLDDEKGDNYSSSNLTQIHYLFWRSALNAKRDKVSSIVRSFQTIFFALMFGAIWYKQGSTEDSIRNINGALYMCLLNTTMLYIMTTCATFSFEIPIILKEHTYGMYRISNYFTAKILTELPLNMILATVFLTIVYFMVNLNSGADRFIICCGITVILANIAIAFGGLISACTPTDKIALDVAGAVMVPLNIFGGYYLNNRTVPDYFLWLRYISWIGYGNEAFLVNQWDGVVNITCTVNPQLCPPNGITGDIILEQLEMEKKHFGRDIGVLVAFYFLFRIVAYLGLVARARLQK